MIQPQEQTQGVDHHLCLGHPHLPASIPEWPQQAPHFLVYKQGGEQFAHQHFVPPVQSVKRQDIFLKQSLLASLCMQKGKRDEVHRKEFLGGLLEVAKRRFRE